MVRILSMSYMPGDPRRLPAIQFQGQWLLHSGFSCGDKVRVDVLDVGIMAITRINNNSTQESKNETTTISNHNKSTRSSNQASDCGCFGNHIAPGGSGVKGKET